MSALIDYRGKTPKKTSFGIPLITAKVVKGGRIETPDEFIAVNDYEPWMRRGIPEAGDIVITTEAPLGEVAQLGAERVALAQRLIALRGRAGLLDNGFLKFLMQSEDVQEQLRARASGTTVLGIKQSELRKILLTLPPFEEQCAIAHILGTLDDKIELNRRMNETLEAMARALFKSWFVDFDPVRAKAEGRDHGLPKPLADLFPDSFEDSELGEVPKGWRVAPLADCVDVVRGLSYKGSGLSDAGVPMHNLNSIYEGGGYKHEGIKHYEGEYKPHHLARAGDLIVANTEQGHDRLLIGYAAVVPARFDNGSLFSHHIYRVRPKSSSALTTDYLCHLLNTSVMHDTVSGYANGTTVNMLPIDALQRPLVVVPSPGIVCAFDGFARAARVRHEEMIDESRTLAVLRDALLPKLISGELRVKGAENIAETSA
jgi:type I restriction enzyme S subunit